jgi:hypothetical protein
MPPSRCLTLDRTYIHIRRSELAIKDRWYAVVQPRSESILRDLVPEDFAFLEEAQPPNRWRKVTTFELLICDHEPTRVYMSQNGMDGEMWHD